MQLYKYAAKSIGMQHGVIPSFMAKPWGNVRSATRLLSFRNADADGSLSSREPAGKS